MLLFASILLAVQGYVKPLDPAFKSTSFVSFYQSQPKISKAQDSQPFATTNNVGFHPIKPIFNNIQLLTPQKSKLKINFKQLNYNSNYVFLFRSEKLWR